MLNPVGMPDPPTLGETIDRSIIRMQTPNVKRIRSTIEVTDRKQKQGLTCWNKISAVTSASDLVVCARFFCFSVNWPTYTQAG